MRFGPFLDFVCHPVPDFVPFDISALVQGLRLRPHLLAGLLAESSPAIAGKLTTASSDVIGIGKLSPSHIRHGG
jgi:hypothetical protein